MYNNMPSSNVKYFKYVVFKIEMRKFIDFGYLDVLYDDVLIKKENINYEKLRIRGRYHKSKNDRKKFK